MLHRGLRLAVAIFAATCSQLALGQNAQPPQYFVVCASQPNQPTVYFSGVLQGPATALAGFRTAFTGFLAQHYAYSGAVGCAPTNNVVNAQNLITNQSSALRKAKKNVVATGWTESALSAAPPVASAAGGAQARTPPASRASAVAATRKGQTAAPGASAAAAGSAADGATGGGGGGANSASQLTSVLGSLFGTSTDSGASSSAGCSGAAATGGKGGAGKSGATGDGNGGGGCQSSGSSTFDQVSKALTSAFAGKGASGTASGEGAPKNPQPPAADGLGSAQAQGTKLVVYGCGRQDTRVACVTALTNQSQKDTLVQAADVWKDAFIVDDRGDRHQRGGGFFLNVDGDQRQQLDISYGKSAQFILMFDGVAPKVQKVSLRSSSAGLDVEEIDLVAPSAAASASQH